MLFHPRNKELQDKKQRWEQTRQGEATASTAQQGTILKGF
jgi:hypothetical protein